MEAERKIFHVFLGLHSHKACTTDEPIAHLQFHNDTLSPDAPLISFTREDVIEELDKESELVRFLLHQMTTYDCHTQRIVGLIFNKQTVLSEVMRVIPQ